MGPFGLVIRATALGIVHPYLLAHLARAITTILLADPEDPVSSSERAWLSLPDQRVYADGKSP